VTVNIRSALPGDENAIVALVGELAEYERLKRPVEATPDEISKALFGAKPFVFCDVAERDGEMVGFSISYYTFSTFRGKHGLFMEVLFVRPRYRRQGIGKALLGRLARRCVSEGLGRLEWMVVDWNSPAIAFYRSRGAKLLDDWTLCRLEGAELKAIGAAVDATSDASGAVFSLP